MNDRPVSHHLSKAEHVAQQILRDLLASGAKPGVAFGTEASLLQKYNISRPTLRECLRILEARGVIRVRTGPGGGIFVARPRVETLAHGLSLLLRFNEIPFSAVLEARELIEPALAFEAARRGSAKDFSDMRASIVRMRQCADQDAFIRENATFHGIIAQASGNKVLDLFWQAISILASGEHHGVNYTRRNQENVAQAHERIADACERRDAEGTSAAMAAHIKELDRLVRKRYRHLLNEPTEITALPARSVR